MNKKLKNLLVLGTGIIPLFFVLHGLVTWIWFTFTGVIFDPLHLSAFDRLMSAFLLTAGLGFLTIGLDVTIDEK